MRYIDSGLEQVDQSVGFWMQEALSEGIGGFHCQAGYFTLEGASILVPVLRQCAIDGASVKLVLGANQGATVASHISYLVGLLDLPRTHVALGVISYADALFHPKVYHVTRTDGSQTAYVGSANLTGSGISGRNVEAGLILDTRAGDDRNVLLQIIQHVDRWFDDELPGLTKIDSVSDVDALLSSRVLVTHKSVVSRESNDNPEVGIVRHMERRRTLFSLPSLPGERDAESGSREVVPPKLERLPDAVFLRATEASFHFPQGTHIGHLLIILRLFSGDRQDTAFDDDFIRLSGSLGEGRLAGYRRQIKYKMLAAIEMGLLNDIRVVSHQEPYSPELTAAGRHLWERLYPIVDQKTIDFRSGVLSTTTIESAAYYNSMMREAQSRDTGVKQKWRTAVLRMQAVRLMLRFIRSMGAGRVYKATIYQTFFTSQEVLAFCDSMGIEPQTETSAQHRLPFILNLLDSCEILEQRNNSVELNTSLDSDLQNAVEEVFA